MPSCRRAAELITQSLDDPLRGHQRACLAVHMLLCGSCRRFRRQITALEAAATSIIGARLGPAQKVELPRAAKQHLQALIRERL